MDSYGQFCPVALAAEILTRRWMPLVVRELLSGSHRFNDLHRGVPRMSRTLLARRLTELEAAGVVERRRAGADDHPEYHLTEAGEALRPVILELGFWGKRWIRRPLTAVELDAGLLMWDMHRRVQRERLPERRIVVHFQFTEGARDQRHFWLLLGPAEVDLCLRDPGYGVDLEVSCAVRTLTEVWMGDTPLVAALKDETLRLRGPQRLRRAFPDWFGLSMFSGPPPETSVPDVLSTSSLGGLPVRPPAVTT